ncbi:hypothetical protein [Actinosynnema sp.]|uniref:hypothetical protein n=1 Tax=Actinosynnema sp. TaxID=1872144 RepID=UPI003F84EDC4
MTLPDVLLVEHPWSFTDHLLKVRYSVRVYAESDAPLAHTEDLGGLGPLVALRRTAFSGRTAFRVALSTPGGPLLEVRKGWGAPPTEVLLPGGRALGSLRKEGGGGVGLHDASGVRLCALGDVAGMSYRQLAKRDGARVRRDVLRLRVGLAEPVRSLAIATGVFYDVVRGDGVNHTSGGPIDSPF